MVKTICEDKIHTPELGNEEFPAQNNNHSKQESRMKDSLGVLKDQYLGHQTIASSVTTYPAQNNSHSKRDSRTKDTLGVLKDQYLGHQTVASSLTT
nr:unnamed protein product [Callosobruchus chinensis]